MRIWGFLFFLDDLQSFDLLEGEAHDAALLALVLEVDRLVVVVDEDLRHKPAVVVEALRPLWDGLVLHLLGLLAHRRMLLPSLVPLYPKRLTVTHRGGFEALFIRVRGRGILRTSQ